MRLILTDLDGTLIDHHTYSAEAARPALDAARTIGVPVVPCSSKTLAEMRTVAARLELAPTPLIVENGGAIWFPDTWSRRPPGATSLADGSSLLVLGASADWLRPRLKLVAAATGSVARGFSRMTDAEVAGRTGLPLDVAALARQREYSEPFVCEGLDVSLAALDAAARRVGARVTRGGRFFHLTGETDKGVAVAVIRATCPTGTRLLGVGDAANDLPLLMAVDDAAIVPGGADGRLHPDLVAALPHARHAPSAGPLGWNTVVLEWLAATESHV
jgi:mannosyl-3-phosphoglycerate phosphatase